MYSYLKTTEQLSPSTLATTEGMHATDYKEVYHLCRDAKICNKKSLVLHYSVTAQKRIRRYNYLCISHRISTVFQYWRIYINLFDIKCNLKFKTFDPWNIKFSCNPINKALLLTMSNLVLILPTFERVRTVTNSIPIAFLILEL